ncbi:MAG TPA: hypothetical protein VI564_07395 [Candidatus Nanoarchaeia archaeon]|nr:hypothetical protein [Candidatus Nanoarchaeia archaeon]
MNIKKKRAEAAALNMIIAAAILLAILVVSFIFISKGSSTFNKDAFGCESKGFKCTVKGQCSTPAPSYTCPKETPVCCSK